MRQRDRRLHRPHQRERGGRRPASTTPTPLGAVCPPRGEGRYYGIA